MTITTDSIGKRFNRDWVFRDLSFTFTSGNIYAITGPNGSGKSTLLQILWGQMPASSGALKYSLNDKILAREEFFRHTAIATPYMELVEEFTLLEQLQFHFRLRKPKDNMSLEDMMTKMYLQEARDKQILNFSSGMRQRLKLGLAFYTSSEAIFLDEPGTNLDEQAFAWYQENLSLAGRGHLIFIASNQKEEYPESAVSLNMRDFHRS